MNTIKYPFSNKICSIITLGGSSEALWKDIDGESILSSMLDLGINVWDGARGYGKWEDIVGRWVKNNPTKREDVFLISKGCLPFLFSRLNPKALRKDIETSLNKLGTYIDLYFLHRDDKCCSLKEIFKVLNEYKEKGLIKAYGVSNWTSERIIEANKVCEENGFAPIVASSVQYSYIPWNKDPFKGGDGCVSIGQNLKELEFYKETQMPIFAFSPLCNGFLSGKAPSNSEDFENKLSKIAKTAFLSNDNKVRLVKLEKLAKKKNISVPTLAIAYILNQGLLVSPICGSTKISSIKENIKALDIVLSKEEIDYLNS